MYPRGKYNHLQNVTFADWPVYDGEETLNAVAGKIIEQHLINNETAVGGASLGGMVAIEIAKILGIRKVILIGSATNPDFVNPLLRKLSCLAEITPVKIIQAFTGKLNQHIGSDLLEMFVKSDSRFIKAMCKAIFKWEGLGKFNCDIKQIHGDKDMVIFPPEENVEFIKGGGHLISITHSAEVAEFIDKHKN